MPLLECENIRLETLNLGATSWRMLKIPWVDSVTNTEMLQRTGERVSLLDTIKKKKRAYIGYIMRHGGLVNAILEGLVEEKICGDMDETDFRTYEEPKRLAQNG